MVLKHIYRMNNGTRWSSVCSMGVWFKLRVSKVNAHLIFVDAQEARDGVEELHKTTGCGENIPRGGVIER